MGKLDGGCWISGRVHVVLGSTRWVCLTAAKEGPDGCELLTGIETGKKRDQRWLMASGMRKESRGRWHVNSDLRMTCEI
jgi:hypothetical protein